MKVTDPQPLLNELDPDELAKYLRYNPLKDSPDKLRKFHLETERDVEVEQAHITYYEPYGTDVEGETSKDNVGQQVPRDTSVPLQKATDSPAQHESSTTPDGSTTGLIKGKVLRLGEFIDTDAVSISPSYASLAEGGETSHSLSLSSIFLSRPSRPRAKEGGLNVCTDYPYQLPASLQYRRRMGVALHGILHARIQGPCQKPRP